MSAITYAHIEHDADGTAFISGTRLKVRMIVLNHIAHGGDIEATRRHYPTLTLGQIHSVLAYYHDHKEAMDRDLAERERQVREFQAQQEESPGRRRLRERGLIP